MTDLATFEQYDKLVDILIEQSTKEQLAESARLLALSVAHYQIKHGEITIEEILAMPDAVESTGQSRLFVQGIENFLDVLGNISEYGGKT